ncbi:hypothetical protein C5L23_001291 [Leuconostoc fallax]|uniref:Sortase n=2 Tax=Leuconostoc fallax TaxID=1251 RepID=A0A4R5N7I5_9LACO|nr:hypothetical protein C5L23_001291 [Leuconostoc fallax]
MPMLKKKTKNSKLKTSLFWLSIILLLVLSLVLIFNRQIAYFTVKHYQPQLTTKSVATAKKEKTKQKNFNWSKVHALTPQQILAARTSAKDTQYIGLVAVPEIGVNLPIAKGTTDRNLSLGAGTLYQNQKMGSGNYALASHFVQGKSYKDLLFSPIYYKGKVGQKIYLTDLSHVYTYCCTTVKTVQPTDVAVTYPVSGKKIVTLITCDYTAERGRVIMQGELIKTTTWQQTSKQIQQQLSAKQKTLSE